MGKRIDNTVCHYLKMHRSAENVTRFYDNMLSPTGITVRQYSLLSQILKHEGCSVRELSEYTELDRSTLARNLKPLLRDGLIADIKNPGARKSKLRLTDSGERIYKQAKELWNSAQKQFEEKLGSDMVSILEIILEKMQSL